MSQITCENLSIGYNNHAVIENLNFSVNSGDYLCITGENGSGKSSLVKTILGLQAPLKGRVIFSDGLTKNSIGYLPQRTEAQSDFPASVKEIILSGFQGKCGFRPFYNRHEKNLAVEAMQRIKIRELENKCFRELSGGQQQRVLLARALCAGSKALILDEPVSGLDPEAASDMYKIIDELNRREHTTIIMVSHDVDKALNFAGRVLNLPHERKNAHNG